MLEGGDVRLRAIAPEDVNVLWHYWADLEMASLASSSPPKPFTLDETKAYFEDLAQKDDLIRSRSRSVAM